ncbi:reverse transcriptase [Senna tora]|uniref:Reverse transcriptase n=1 Tax=Senna tora TaxID=362788 RepID=A0A834WUY9_9FABA|nr:reverse transcriptase [Senna tora]
MSLENVILKRNSVEIENPNLQKKGKWVEKSISSKASISVFVEDDSVKDVAMFSAGKVGSKKDRKKDKRRGKELSEEFLVDVPVKDEGFFPDDWFKFKALGRSAKGFGAALTVKELKDLCRNYKPLVVFLMETRSGRRRMEKLKRRHRLSFEHSLYVDAKVDAVGCEAPNFISMVYGPLKEGERRIVWDKLRELSSNVVGSWLGEAHIKEKLDRVVGNSDLLCRFPKAQVFVNPPVGSDHCALVFDLNFSDLKTPRSFTFEMFWVDHHDFKDVVSRGWGDWRGDSGIVEALIKRLDVCRDILIKWSRLAFPNCRKVIKELNEQLQFSFDGPFSVEKKELIEEITKKIEFEWDREELVSERSGVRDFSKVLGFVGSRISDVDNDLLLRRSSWDQVGDHLVKVVTEYFEQGVSLDAINSTNIVFVPKVDRPEKVGQFRPISLCNFSYKVVSKDNIIIAHEVFHFLKNRRGGKRYDFALKTDMNKVYDRLEWDFLREVLMKFDFDIRWVNIIMGCVSSVSFNLLLSGKKVSKFRPGRGVRQGDPLSPYLFIIVAEVLSLMVSHHVKAGLLKGVKLARYGPVLSHCFFADDALFFMRACKEECVVLKGIIADYCLASGQEVNFDKSYIYFSNNTPDDVKEERRVAKFIRRLGINLLGARRMVVSGLYFPEDGFMNARKGHRASWAWSSILEGRRIVLEGQCWRTGNGASVNV